MGTLSEVQRTAAMHLLQTILSAKGYAKVQEIMGSDQALSEGGTHYASAQPITPSASSANPMSRRHGCCSLGPSPRAERCNCRRPRHDDAHAHRCQPAVYQHGGKTVRVLAQENDKAFALLASFNGQQRRQAVLRYEVDDLVLGPGHDDEVTVFEGVKGSALNARQQTMLLD